nr:glycosyltransferase [Candidatus Levybacteria bacterium]
MRIGIFDPYFNTLGGGEKYILTAASCLAKNHEVFLFWDGDIVKDASKRFNIDFSSIKQIKNIFSKDVSFPKRLIESNKYDAILFLSDGSLPVVACKLYIHFQFPVEWVNTDNIIVKQKIKRVSKFICNSEFTKNFIDKKFNKKSIVLYPPSYFLNDFPKINYKNKKNQILNVGRLQESKSGKLFKKQDLLIKNFKKIYDSGFSGWQLVLVVTYKKEDENLLDKLKELIGNYPIKIIENCSQEELKKIYLQSKIYWHASGFGEDLEKYPELAEHFGISTVEAMINGVIPVVINAGGQKEIVKNEKNGYLWNTEQELLEKTQKLINDQDLMIRLVTSAISDAKEFSTDRFCKEINKIFNE